MPVRPAQAEGDSCVSSLCKNNGTTLKIKSPWHRYLLTFPAKFKILVSQLSLKLTQLPIEQHILDTNARKRLSFKLPQMSN